MSKIRPLRISNADVENVNPVPLAKGEKSGRQAYRDTLKRMAEAEKKKKGTLEHDMAHRTDGGQGSKKSSGDSRKRDKDGKFA